MKTFSLLICLLTLCVSLVNLSQNTPIIAIYANTMPNTSEYYTADYVNVNYVRWLESYGAQVIVIHIWSSPSVIDDILSKANAVLLQGGGRDLKLSNQWEKTSKYILSKVIELNNSGVFIPLWGTCQGFELLHVLVADDTKVLGKFRAHNIASAILPVEEEIKTSRLFSQFSDRDIKIIKNEAVTQQFHFLGIELETYNWRPELNNFFKITSFGEDIEGKFYIASVEARNYPIYGVQFHPEKTPFDRKVEDNIPQSTDALIISQRFAEFFVKEARKSKSSMTQDEKIKYDLINTFENGGVVAINGLYVYNRKADKMNENGNVSERKEKDLMFLN